ncbi:hypothetical protein [Nostoc sp.]|uniref:hypothetical protein n=1 Tax=Nostoc sp. TaxID=1180 RepID=UPI002FF780C8
MGWATREPVVEGAHVAHPTRLDNLFLGSPLERVARGEKVILLEQDKAVARLVPPLQKEERLATMKQFRNSLTIKGARKELDK